MSEWPTVMLSEVADLTVGHVGPMATEYVPSGVPFLRSQNVLPMRLDLSEVKFVSRRFHERLAKSALRPGDVVIVRTGRPGASAVIPDDLAEANCADLVVIRCGSRLDPRFLSYFVNALAGAHVSAYTVGAVQQHFNVGAAKVMRVPLPPTDEQRRIAGILGALDDKIELNRRTNATLEATARALFKSWFMAEAGTEAEGWRSCTIGDLAEVVGGSTPSTAEPRFWNGTHYWATPKDLAGLKTPVLLRTERMLTDAGIGQISSGLLPAGTVLMSSRAPIGYLAITEVPVAINQGFIAMKPRPGVSGLFLLHWAASSQDEILSRANGSTFLEISKSSFRPIEVYAPPADVMASFDRVVRPIHERVVANERQIGVVAEIRDALLPRLLSGEGSSPLAESS